MLAAESYKDIGVSELEWEKDKEIERREDIFYYKWFPLPVDS